LVAHLAPSQLDIDDQRHRPAGHAGAAGGQSHFHVRIVSDAFRGLTTIARHRLVFEAVGDLMKTDIHALSLETLTPP
jgi:BolA protein